MKIFSEKRAEDYNWLKMSVIFFDWLVGNDEFSDLRDQVVTAALELYNETAEGESVFEWFDNHDFAMEQAWKSVVFRKGV